MLTLKEVYNFEMDSEGSLFRINDFVSELIPVFHSSPYQIKEGDVIESLYTRFKKREIGGWCSLCAEFMLVLLDFYKVPAYRYNYGLRGTEFTHMVVIADGFLLDPYFNKCYVDANGKLMKFETLTQKIIERDFSFSTMYSTLSVKTKRIDTEEGYQFITMTGQEWEKSLMDSWIQKAFHDKMMSEFGDDNPCLLMLRSV